MIAHAERTQRAARLLADAGIDAAVTVAGQEGEIAAVRAQPERLEDVARLAPAMRALGFRYVALELDASPERPG